MPAGVSWLTLAAVLVDAVLALGTVATWVAEALVDVVLTVDSGRAIWTLTFVAVDEVLARPLVLAWKRAALIYFRLTQKTRVPWVAHAVEGVVAINARSVAAWRREAVIYVGLAVPSSKAWTAATTVAGNSIHAGSSMLARL